MIGQEDLQRIKENSIGVASGANWASQTSAEEIRSYEKVIGEERFLAVYPYAEYPEYGIPAALSTDNPCSPGIMDVFGYVQVLVNGYDHSKPIDENSVLRRDKFITVEQALKMFTYNGAWMSIRA